MDIRDKVALVTGAASGIGRATAVALASAGAAAVVVADVDEAGGAETVDQVEGLGAAGAFVATDVRDLKQLRHLFVEAERRFGGLDVVHNNAGVVSGGDPWPATPVEKVQQVVDVNVRGTLLGTRLAIDALGRRGGGAIVNTASIAGLAPMPTDAAYAASKAAIILFTQSCAALRESHGIRVNAVLPGMVETPILAKTGDGTRPAGWLEPILGSIALLAPSRIAEAVLALVADDGAAGQTVVVANEGAWPPGS